MFDDDDLFGEDGGDGGGGCIVTLLVLVLIAALGSIFKWLGIVLGVFILTALLIRLTKNVGVKTVRDTTKKQPAPDSEPKQPSGETTND